MFACWTYPTIGGFLIVARASQVARHCDCGAERELQVAIEVDHVLSVDRSSCEIVEDRIKRMSLRGQHRFRPRQIAFRRGLGLGRQHFYECLQMESPKDLPILLERDRCLDSRGEGPFARPRSLRLPPGLPTAGDPARIGLLRGLSCTAHALFPLDGPLR